MDSAFLLYKSSRVHYRIGGTGGRLLLCFHGYGESADSFSFLEEPLGISYTLLAIDMPFHGQTDWKEGLSFPPKDLLEIIRKIMTIQDISAVEWTLLGYSMGGRIALHLLQEVPALVKRIVLAAPDGIRVNPWYWLATQTRPGNFFFRWTMEHPGWFFTMLRTGNVLKLVNRSVYKFTAHYIGDIGARRELYRRWTTMREFRPKHGLIAGEVRQRETPVRMIYGKYDRIIRWERAGAFLQSLGSQGEMKILNAGHQLLQAQNRDTLVEMIRG